MKTNAIHQAPVLPRDDGPRAGVCGSVAASGPWALLAGQSPGTRRSVDALGLTALVTVACLVARALTG